MRTWLIAAGATLVVLGGTALVVSAVLRDSAEEAWQDSIAQLQSSLGHGGSVRHGELEIDLLGRGGTVRDLEVSAPGGEAPFTLSIGQLDVAGLAQEGAEGLRFREASAEAVTLATRWGRWQADGVHLRRVVLDDSTIGGPDSWSRRWSFDSGVIEGLTFDGGRPLEAAAESSAAESSAAGGSAAAEPSVAVPAPKASLARAELSGLQDGRLASLRFERLDAGTGAEVRIAAARGDLEALDITLIVSGFAGRVVPTRAVASLLRLEELSLAGAELALHAASLTLAQRSEGERLLSELTVEGLGPEPPVVPAAAARPLDSLWKSLEEAGYRGGFRLSSLLLVAPHGERLELRSLRLELPQAAYAELDAELGDLSLAQWRVGAAAAEQLLLRARLESAGLTLVDEGGLDAILAGPAGDQGMTPKQLRQVAAFQVAEALRQGEVPRELGLAIQEFLAGPGRLEIELRPPEPVPLAAFALLGVAPEQASETLGITAQSTPRP